MGTRSARELGAADWELARFLICDEGLTYAEAARRLAIKPNAIRMRAARGAWSATGDPKTSADIDSLIAQRSDRQLLRVQMAMDAALSASVADADAKALAQALQKSELIGKHARSSQSLARASNVLAHTKTKLFEFGQARAKAQPQKIDRMQMLKNIEEKFDAAERRHREREEEMAAIGSLDGGGI